MEFFVVYTRMTARSQRALQRLGFEPTLLSVAGAQYRLAVVTCSCQPDPPLCWSCEDACVNRHWRTADTLGRAWGLEVWRRRPGEAWPAWDSDSDRADRMRAIALRKVTTRIGRDLDAAAPRVLARLARCAGVVAGRTYAWHAEQGAVNRPPA